jgi:hypothetical protein
MAINHVVAGFSRTNRWLVYTSALLFPAQAISGLGSNCPSNLGFLAYSFYSAVQYFRVVQAKESHALSMVIANFNLFNNIIYLGGVTSANYGVAVLLALVTTGMMILNNVSAWLSWSTNQSDGFGVYQFFFFGWRTLSPGWHKFFLLWTIADTVLTIVFVGLAFHFAIMAVKMAEEENIEWWWRYPAIPIGAAISMLFYWLLIMWTELIVARNHIESDTDYIAVWLFIAQVVTMLIPLPCI